MLIGTQQLRKWSRIAVAAGFLAGGTAFGQVPNLGNGGVPNVGGAGSVPNPGSGVPNLSGPGVPNVGGRGGVPNLNRQSGVPRVNQRNVPNVGNNIRRTQDQATSQTRNGISNGINSTTTKVNSTANRFQTPQADNPDYNKSLPVRLNAESIQGLGQQGSLGFHVDTTGTNLRVGKVETGSLAANAGLQADDEIMAVNRSWVQTMDQFRHDLSTSLQSQGRAWVMVNRNGKQQWINVDADGTARSAMGTSYTVENGQLKLTNVFDGFAAAQSGLKVGDRIVSINGQQISSRADYLTQISSNAGNTLNLVIDRNGATQTVTAQLPAARDAGVASVQQVQSAVDELQTLTGNLRNSADEQTKPRYNQLQQQVRSLSEQVAAIQGNAADMTQQRSEQIRNALGQISTTAENLKGSVTGQSAQQLQNLQDRVAVTQSTVQNLVKRRTDAAMARTGQGKNAAGSVGNSASNKAGAVQDRTTNRPDNATTMAQQRRQQLTRQIQSLAERIKGISQNQRGVLTQQINAVEQRIAALQRTATDTATDTTKTTAAMLRGAADQASEVRAELEALRAEASVETDSSISAAATQAAELEAAYSLVAMAEASDPSQLVTEAQTRAAESSQQLITAINQVQGDPAEDVVTLRDRAVTEAQQLSQDVQQLKGNQRERIAAVREQAAIVQTRLLIAAKNSQGLTRTQLAKASGRAGAVRGRLNEYAIAAGNDARQTRDTVMTQGQERLQSTVTTLKSTAGTVQGATRQQVESAGEKLDSARQMIMESRDDAIDAAAGKRSQMMTRLTEARSSMVEAARQAPSDVQSTLIEQIAKVETVQEDLNTQQTLNAVRANASSQQVSALGIEANTVAGRIVVNSVRDGSLAARAGLQTGDEVVAVNGQNVGTEAELFDKLKVASDANQSATVTVRRGDSQQTLTVQAGDVSLTRAR